MVVDSPPEETVALANTWRLSSVERASMTEQVLRELREAIVEGRIPQGEPLREVSLAATLGTGRRAGREAVRQLIQEGLVDYEPHRGAFVRVMSLADRLDVYVAREAIETGAARCILDAAPPDLSDVRRALEALRDTAHEQDRVTQSVIDAHIRFHQELVRLARHPRVHPLPPGARAARRQPPPDARPRDARRRDADGAAPPPRLPVVDVRQ